MMPSQSQASSIQRILTGGTARRVVLLAVTSAVVASAAPSQARPAPQKQSKTVAKAAALSTKNRAARRQVKPAKRVAKAKPSGARSGSRFIAVSAAAPAGSGFVDPNAPSLLQVPVQAAPAGEVAPTAVAPAPVAPVPVAPLAVETPTVNAPALATPTTVPVTPTAVPVAPVPVVNAPPVTPPDVSVVPSVPVPTVTAPAVPVPGVPAPATPVAPLPDPANPAPAPAPEVTPPATITEQATALRGLGEIRRRQQRFAEATDFFRRATLLDPANIQARIGLAQSLRGTRRYQEALVESEQALALGPNNLQARVIHAQLLGDTNRPEEAAKELDALVASLPEKPEPETYYALGQSFVSLRNYDAALALLGQGKQDWPEDAIIARNYAETLTYAKRWDAAIAAWDAMIAADPKDADAVLGKARVYNYSSREELAEPLYRQVLQIEPDNYQAQVELADIVGRHGKWPEAIQLYRSALAKNAGDLPTRVELARVLRYSGRYAEADAELTQVLAADARYSPAYTERGILRGQNKQYDLAVADLQQALKITPDDVMAQFGLAEVLGYNKQYDESIRLYRAALSKEPDSQKGRVELGLVLSYAGRPDEAIKEFDAVLTANPQNQSARIGKADTLARLRRYDESIALYNTILENDPNNRRANTGLAEAYVYSKQYTRAIAIYDKLIAANPGDVSLAVDRARSLGYAGMRLESVKALRAVVQGHPDNQDARYALAEAETNSGDRALRDDAIAQYRTLLKADPNNLDARLGLGRALAYQGRTREAEAELKAVAMARPNDPDAYYALAETQRYIKPFEAKENYERAVKLGPNSPNYGRSLIALRELRRQTRPSLDLSARRYTDTNNVRLTEYGGGPTFRTKQGTIGVYVRDGRYEDEGFWQTRRAFSLLLARKFGPISARLLLSRVQYAVAPDRTLYDLQLEKSSGIRKRVYLNIARREIIESLGATNAGITSRQITAGIEWPLAPHFDVALEGRSYSYSDGNRRNTLSPSLYYRLRPTQPSLRVGLGYTRDNTRFLSPAATPYYTPQDYKTFALLADYVKTQGRTRYGVFAAHPLSDSTGTGGLNRPSDTLFGFVQHDLSDLVQLFVEGGIVRGPNFDSNDISGGISIGF